MVWTGFRPSDDPVRYHFNIPVNMFASVVMRDLTTIARDVWHDDRMANNAWGLSVEIQRGIEQYGTLELAPFGRIYAYEVDGRGHANVMDDANIPSLLSIPYFGYLPKNNSLYLATRKFALSDRNPYFYQRQVRGRGSAARTRRTATCGRSRCASRRSRRPTSAEVDQVFGWIAVSDVGDHRLHESFNSDWPETYTREDFAWPNALYARARAHAARPDLRAALIVFSGSADVRGGRRDGRSRARTPSATRPTGRR